MQICGVGQPYKCLYVYATSSYEFFPQKRNVRQSHEFWSNVTKTHLPKLVRVTFNLLSTFGYITIFHIFSAPIDLGLRVKLKKNTQIVINTTTDL